MCSIFKCFGWILDIIQRIITFVMAGVIFCAICIGCVVATCAGIAYGYNISLAEYLDLKQSDITVYVRRGQFGDKHMITGNLFRRSGDSNDIFSSNERDYQEKYGDEARPLSDAWQRAQDTNTYADKLTKYSNIKNQPEFLKTETKMEDEMFDGFVADDIPTTRPPYTGSVQPPLVNTREPDNLQKSQTEDDTYLKVLGLRPNNPIRKKPKKKKKNKKTTINVGADENSLYLKPNMTNYNQLKYKFSTEDFDEEEPNEIQQKPV